ncbi:2202_t:CDS:2, partial [Ambispora leptoticha]
PRTPEEAQNLYERIRNCALWLDSIPGLPIPVGLDAILGLIPSIGDFSGLILGMYQIYLISWFDIPFGLLLKMIGHVILDFIIGIIPGIGDVLDMFYRSNLYNLSLLEAWLKAKYGDNIYLYDGVDQRNTKKPSTNRRNARTFD